MGHPNRGQTDLQRIRGAVGERPGNRLDHGPMTKGLLLLVGWGFLGCGAVPHRAEFITEKKALARANLETNGILAFEVDNGVGAEVAVDFVHQQSRKTFRVTFTPEFRDSMTFSLGPVKPGEKYLSKDMVSESVALFQLPGGAYSPSHIYTTSTGRQRGLAATGSAFEIVPGKITSAGRVEIRVDNYLGFLSKNLRIVSGSTSIDPAIRSVRDASIAKREIVPTRLQINSR